MRHDPQHDDPDLETDVGQCPECEGKDCSAPAQKIVTKYDPPSIPVRCFDWTAVTDDYEPGDLIGYGYTEAQAIADLREQIAERAEAA
jgi:hypothetical protein